MGTTKDTSLPFKVEPQKNTEWCWAAVTVSVDRFFRPTSKKSQCQIVGKALNKSCCGSGQPVPPDSPCNLQGLLHEELKKLGLLARDPLLEPATFPIVQREVDAGRPLCVLIKWRDKKGVVTNRGHFITISGYSLTPSGKAFVTIDDPLFGVSSVDYAGLADPDFGYHDGTGKWFATFLVQRPT
ncbi:MAG: hypothetical protein NTZ56_07600 [Acidobacteria bacterium]|nr:hypothetical protein [Acidobacteriota bacterium]